MADKSHEGLKWVMRAGYGARGAIYLLIGGLAFWAAFSSGQAEGTKGALATLKSEPMGNLALWAIGVGLFAYMIWRVVAGVADVEEHGNDLKGLIARGGQVGTGLIHAAIGVSVVGLAYGGGGGGGGAEDWTQTVMSMPMGRILVALGALVLAGAGIYYVHKGWTGAYRKHLASAQILRRADPFLKAGLIIYGLLLVLVAVSLGFAAFSADAEQAGGLGQALQQLRSVAYGRFVLAAAGLGLVAFALYNFAEAAFRVVPRISGMDVKTLQTALKA